jgi:membrane protein
VLALSTLFAAIFKMRPDAVVDWKDAWFGGRITGVLFVAGRYVIALCLTYTAPASIYGAAGSLVLLLLWVYYSSLVLFFGAALTKARTLESGKAVVPRAMAVRVKEEILD